MNLGFRTELGIHLLQRHTIGDLAAVTAVFANILIDHGVFGGGWQFAALLPPATLVGTLTIINKDGRTFDFRQFN